MSLLFLLFMGVGSINYNITNVEKYIDMPGQGSAGLVYLATCAQKTMPVSNQGGMND